MGMSIQKAFNQTTELFQFMEAFACGYDRELNTLIYLDEEQNATLQAELKIWIGKVGQLDFNKVLHSEHRSYLNKSHRDWNLFEISYYAVLEDLAFLDLMRVPASKTGIEGKCALPGSVYFMLEANVENVWYELGESLGYNVEELEDMANENIYQE